jgi:hypothetical protein
LRAIGLNAVLAFAGAPVREQALQLSPLSVCASMALVDSLLNGKSKFLAEVDRVRQTIQLAGSGKAVLFLIDEIFSGTNSRDRHVAAEAVVRTLLDRGAVGALSTHDMSLNAIADAEGLCGANVHMCAKDGRDAVLFPHRGESSSRMTTGKAARLTWPCEQRNVRHERIEVLQPEIRPGSIFSCLEPVAPTGRRRVRRAVRGLAEIGLGNPLQ